MNAKILIVALCAFQLASGDQFTDASNSFMFTLINPALNNLSVGIANGQALLNTATQQLNGNYTAAMQNIQTTTQNTLNSIQQAGTAANATSAQVQACVAQANQSLSALSSSTLQQLQTQATSANASIQGAAQSLANVSSTSQSTLTTASQNFATCIKNGNPLLFPLTVASCTLQFGTNVIQVVTNQVQTAIQAATEIANQVLGSSISSASQSVISNVNATIKGIQQLTQDYATQASSIASNAAACISKAANTTASG